MRINYRNLNERSPNAAKRNPGSVLFSVKPPQTEAELLNYTKAIAGKSLAELANIAGIKAPENLLRAKGWTGQLLECFLGTTAGNKAAPDFSHLNIELKTIPINANGQPKETTYVCVAPLMKHVQLQWRDSIVYQKLKRVLWVPVQADPAIRVPERRIGMAALWSPTPEQEKILQQDWEEHMEKIARGTVETITAHQGMYMQIRPKAANSKALTTAIGPDGKIIQTLPRGFYLRTQLTRQILAMAYV